MSRLLSGQAEGAVRLLNRTVAGHTEALRALSRFGSGYRRRLTPDVDGEQLQRQATLIRCVSIAESFASQRLTDRVGSWADDSAEPVQTLWSSEVVKATFTWESLKDQYSRWLDVKDPSMWRPMLGLAQVRNAVAHGLGQLTRVQLQPKSYERTIQLLRDINFAPTTDNRIVLTCNDIHDSARICREFIVALDLRTQDESKLQT